MVLYKITLLLFNRANNLRSRDNRATIDYITVFYKYINKSEILNNSKAILNEAILYFKDIVTWYFVHLQKRVSVLFTSTKLGSISRVTKATMKQACQ